MTYLESIYSQWKTQKSSADFWISEWEKNLDRAGQCNALFALGKLSGMTEMVGSIYTRAGRECPITDAEVSFYAEKFHAVRCSSPA